MTAHPFGAPLDDRDHRDISRPAPKPSLTRANLAAGVIVLCGGPAIAGAFGLALYGAARLLGWAA